MPSDIVAGLAVAALAVPQGMAYALVAGLPPETGLLAAALPAAAAALFGSSPHLVTGPTNPVALLVGASMVAPAVAAGGPVPLGTVLQATLLAGVFLCGFAVLDLGRASRFVSDSVIAGFATGAGLLIALGQVPAALGTSAGAVEGLQDGPPALALLRAAIRALGSTDPRAAALAAGVPLGVLALRRVDPRLPGPLLALGAAAGVAAAAGWDDGPGGIPLLSGIAAGPHGPAAPTLSDPLGVAAPALAIALLTSVQSIAAARALPPRRGRLDPNRELFGQGVANLVAAFVGAMPACGSLTRSALARAAGGRSRLAPLLSGLGIALALPLLGAALVRVPLSALAGLVVLSGLDLINPRALRRAALTRGDLVVLVGTLVATLWVDLVQAVYAGLLLSLALLVRRAGRLRISELLVAAPGRFREIPVDGRTGATAIVVLNLEGDLSFAVAPDLRDNLEEIASRGARVLVLRLKRAQAIDATVAEALRRTVSELSGRGVRVLLCGLDPGRIEFIRGSDLGRAVGEGGVIPTGERLAEGLERAVRYARTLAPSVPGRPALREEAPDDWTWEI